MRSVKRQSDSGDTDMVGDEVRASSVIMGLIMIAAVTVALAAFMGGSLGQIESRLANATDSMARGVGLAVERVVVTGLDNDPQLKRDVRAAAMVEPGENMFRADPYAIRDRVEATQMVVNVRVYRYWPNKIEIQANPAHPLAAVYKDGDWTGIDHLGRQLVDDSPDVLAALPRIMGVAAESAAADLFDALEAAPALNEQFLLAERVAERRWTLHLETRRKVMLPEDELMGAALAQLEALAADHDIFGSQVQTIDLRIPGQVFVTKQRPTNDEGHA